MKLKEIADNIPLKSVSVDFEQIAQKKYSVATDFLKRSIWQNHISRDFQTGTDDRVMAYRKGSVPYALATMFDLNTTFNIDSVDKGMNNNGLYFYN